MWPFRSKKGSIIQDLRMVNVELSMIGDNLRRTIASVESQESAINDILVRLHELELKAKKKTKK